MVSRINESFLLPCVNSIVAPRLLFDSNDGTWCNGNPRAHHDREKEEDCMRLHLSSGKSMPVTLISSRASTTVSYLSCVC